MSFEKDAELLDEYNRWQSAKKVAGVDTTPAAFLVERAQASAYDKIVDTLTYIAEVKPEDVKSWPGIMQDIIEILES